MSGFLKAFRDAREQQRRVQAYQDFRNQPITQRLLENVQGVVNSTGQPMYVRLDGDQAKQGAGWIEVRPQSAPASASRYQDMVRSGGIDLSEMLDTVAKQAREMDARTNGATGSEGYRGA
jgi:hypothetical protein